MKVVVTPAKALCGEITLPGDKSITHRVLMIGAISEGTTEVYGFSTAGDPLSTMTCLRSLGVEMSTSREALYIKGKGLGKLKRPLNALDAGNSGTTIRLLAGILAAQPFDSTITGDSSLSRRPMKRVIDPLREMGAIIDCTDQYTPPLHVHQVARLHGIDYDLPVPSAQVKSAIILAALHAEGRTRIVENVASRDHTERMLNLKVRSSNGERVIEVEGQKMLWARSHRIPGDISAAAYFIIGACLLPNSELLIKGVGLNPTRTALLDLLKEMGARIEIIQEKVDDAEPRGDLLIRSSSLKNVPIPPELIPQIIDEIPILSIAGALSKGTFEIRGATELRVKESDRIRSMCENLRAMGVDV